MASTYTNGGCRCDDCRLAAITAQRDRRRRLYVPRTKTFSEELCLVCGEWFRALGHHEIRCAERDAQLRSMA